jgi:hypothetical protein
MPLNKPPLPTAARAPVSPPGIDRYFGRMGEPEPSPAGLQDEAEQERERRSANIVLLVFFLFVVAAGIWLVGAMIEQRQIDDCVAQGRRNCQPIDLPAR